MADKLDYSRRVFLRALGLGAAGLVVGGGAAWAQSQIAQKEAAQEALRLLQAQMAQAQTNRVTQDSTLTSLQTRVTTLDAELAAATSQNAQLASALSSWQKDANDLRTQLDEAKSRLSTAESRLAHYQELIALYDQLEGAGLDFLAGDGLKTAAAGLTSALGVSPLVQSGLQSARDLLTAFEGLLPDFNSGLTWLSEQMIQLRLGLFSLEKAARATVTNAATGVVAVFGGFIKFVIDYMPFDVGEKVRATLDQSQKLITQTSEMTKSSDEKVFNKMSRYVSGGAESWQKTLVTPLREKTLAPTEQLVTALHDANQTFTTALQTPVQKALEKRAALKAQIAEHRAKHQL